MSDEVHLTAQPSKKYGGCYGDNAKDDVDYPLDMIDTYKLGLIEFGMAADV